MDPLLVSALISQGMRLWADYADRAASGTLTDADLDAMASHLGHDVASFQAMLDAKKA